MIRKASISDAGAICAIYNHYVETTCITFEEEIVSENEMAGRIDEIIRSLPWFVWEEQGIVLGYAYASRWKSRSAYRYSAECAVYVRHDAVGRGIGRTLYQHLIADLREVGMHSIIGGIALPNAASQRLHEKAGFKKVAHFEQVGWKFKKWIDVGYWELTFDRKPADGGV
jgi:L-amino acid N-acyltransferase YncA